VAQAKNAPANSSRDAKLAMTLGQYVNWSIDHQVDALPLSALVISGYLIDFTIRLKGSAKSVPNKISHLRVWAKKNGEAWLSDREASELADLVKILEYQDFSSTRRVRPLTINIVHKLIALRGSDSALGLCVASLYSFGHDGLFRAGEITSALQGSDISFSTEGGMQGINVSLLRTKTHRKGGPAKVRLDSYGHKWSSVRTITKWMAVRSLHKFPNRFLFPEILFDHKGSPSGLDFAKSLSYRSLVRTLRHDLRRIGLDPRKYCGHSFRAGGATDLFLSPNITLAQIMLHGRWVTVESAMKYFRARNEASAKAAAVFGSFCFPKP
jgi:hypothetical protein